MRLRTAGLLLAASIAAAMLASGCGGDDDSDEPSSDRQVELIVGDVLPLSGPAAGGGASAQKAAQLAVEEINDAIAEAGVDHTVEIVHQDAGAGLEQAVRRLLAADARCIVAAWSSRGMRQAVAAARDRALLLDPRAPAESSGRPGVISLPLRDPTRLIPPEPPGSAEDPSAEFARLYGSTDPPIGPARAADGRQFDSVILCYLAAVASPGSTVPTRAALSARGAAPRRAFAWSELSEAIEALGRGAPITYRGVTLRAGVASP